MYVGQFPNHFMQFPETKTLYLKIWDSLLCCVSVSANADVC